MNIRADIAKQKQSISQTERNIIRVLSRDRNAVNTFKNINRRLKLNRSRNKQLGANDSAVIDEPSWYEAEFIQDLFNFGGDIIKHERISASEQKELELELNQLEAKNASLDKQIALQDRLSTSQKASMFGGSFVDELLGSPVKLVAVGVGVWALITKPWK